MAELDVIDAIGSSDFVCSVNISDLGSEAGQEKALSAARFAMTAIALTWQTPSKALNGLNLVFDRQPHRRLALAFIPEKGMFSNSSWSHLPSGPHIKSEEWENILADRADIFAVVGEMLHYVIRPSRAAARPHMMSTLYHAFLWFHEGCREPSSHIAVTKLAASLDALACGKKSKGILSLIGARLNIESSKLIRPDGPTVKNVIERIYDQGRSRLIHGNNEELSGDWTDMKAVAEHFGRVCLLHCLKWIANNPDCDDPHQLRLNTD